MRLVHQATIHLASRLGSVGLSFLLFAWIGRVLTTPEATNAYFFSFALGFGLATARMTLQLGSAIDGNDRSSQRARAARQGLAILRAILPMLAIGVGCIAWIFTLNPLLALLATAVTLLAAPDIDLLRGIVGRSSIFAASFSAGSLLALVLLQWVLPRTLTGVVLALLIQWMPVCVLNASAIRRMLSDTRKIRPTASMIFGTLTLAGFDGLILNAPFFGWLPSSDQTSHDLALVMRVFVASLPILPLLMHWSNSTSFGRLCNGFGVSLQTGFMLGLLTSGLFAGCLFLSSYAAISKQPVGVNVIGMYVMLLGAYSLFAPKMRFAATMLPSRQRIRLISIASVVYFAALAFATHSNLSTAIVIVSLQALTLAGTALWFRQAMGSTGNQSSNSPL